MRQFIFITLFVLILSTLGYGQRVIANDSRRTIYSGSTASLDVYELPMWKGQSSLDGFSRTTAGEAGFDTDVWNEAGSIARTSVIKSSAVIWVINGEANPQEAYLVGCTKNGKPFMNRIRKKKAFVAVTERKKHTDCDEGYTWDAQRELCVIKGKKHTDCDEGYTWDAQRQLCVIQGEHRTICEKESDVYNERLNKCVAVAETLKCEKDQFWHTKKERCVKKEGNDWWKWALGIGSAAVVTYVIVDAVNGNDNSCKKGCGVKHPTKNTTTTASGGSSTRPKIIFGYAANGSPIYLDESYVPSNQASVPTQVQSTAKPTKATCKDWSGDLCVAY